MGNKDEYEFKSDVEVKEFIQAQSKRGQKK